MLSTQSGVRKNMAYPPGKFPVTIKKQDVKLFEELLK